MTDKVDPLYDQADAWSLKMEPGITYRINLSPRKGCASIGVYPPGTRSFGAGRRVVFRECGGYFTADSRAWPRRHLQPARLGTAWHRRRRWIPPSGSNSAAGRPRARRPAEQRREGLGSLSGEGIDVVDLYRFDVAKLSTVHAALTSGAGLQFALTQLDGSRIADATPGGTLRETLKEGTYLLAVSAQGRTGGSYSLSLLVRVVTKTTLTADGKAKVTVPVGNTVVLRTATTPTPGGGTVRLVLEYQDPLAGWVYRRSWDVSPGSSVQFTPPASAPGVCARRSSGREGPARAHRASSTSTQRPPDSTSA